MNVGKFVMLPDGEKMEAIERSHNCVKTFCSLCGKKVNGENYCWGCRCFVCPECDDDDKKHVCVGAK